MMSEDKKSPLEKKLVYSTRFQFFNSSKVETWGIDKTDGCKISSHVQRQTRCRSIPLMNFSSVELLST